MKSSIHDYLPQDITTIHNVLEATSRVGKAEIGDQTRQKQCYQDSQMVISPEDHRAIAAAKRARTNAIDAKNLISRDLKDTKKAIRTFKSHLTSLEKQHKEPPEDDETDKDNDVNEAKSKAHPQETDSTGDQGSKTKSKIADAHCEDYVEQIDFSKIKAEADEAGYCQNVPNRTSSQHSSSVPTRK